MTRRKVANQDDENISSKRTRLVKDKFIQEIKSKIQHLVPLNAKQSEYIRLIKEKPLVIACGFAGTSKTYIPTVMACDALLLGSLRGGIDKIILSRPNISNSKSLGFFKGSMEDKMSQWLAPVLSVMYERLGREVTTLHIEKGNIEFLPLEVIKGYSASDCFMLIDESEDLSWDEAKKVVTRQGKNCRMILAGDLSQSELKESSGMKKLIDIAKKNPQLDVGLIDFNDYADIVRSKSVREWIKVLHKESL